MEENQKQARVENFTDEDCENKFKINNMKSTVDVIIEL
jgi:hypothetical protein